MLVLMRSSSLSSTGRGEVGVVADVVKPLKRKPKREPEVGEAVFGLGDGSVEACCGLRSLVGVVSDDAVPVSVELALFLDRVDRDTFLLSPVKAILLPVCVGDLVGSEVLVELGKGNGSSGGGSV